LLQPRFKCYKVVTFVSCCIIAIFIIFVNITGHIAFLTLNYNILHFTCPYFTKILLLLFLSTNNLSHFVHNCFLSRTISRCLYLKKNMFFSKNMAFALKMRIKKAAQAHFVHSDSFIIYDMLQLSRLLNTCDHRIHHSAAEILFLQNTYCLNCGTARRTDHIL